jgi:Ca-activated chloride channel homolog
MDWARPLLLLLALPALAALWWAQLRSLPPLSPRRRRALLAVRAALTLLILVALAGPAWQQLSEEQAVIFVMDHSKSQGQSGLKAAYGRANRLIAALPADTWVGVVSAGAGSAVRRMPQRPPRRIESDPELMANDGSQTDLAGAVELASGLFPPGAARRLVIVGDGLETRGDLETVAREAAVSDIVIDLVPVAGEARRDVRVVRLRPSRSRLHEGASLSLRADIESSLAGQGRVRLFENGVEVESRALKLKVGEQTTVSFKRTPDRRNLYNYQVRLEGFAADSIPENNEAMTLVDVRGQPVLLYIGEEDEDDCYLAEAMAKEGIRLVVQPPQALPTSLQRLAAYDGVIISDVPAHRITERNMTLIRDYVEKLGGGFMMIGGKNSFGAGGYYRTPLEDILPVKLQAPDQEERHSVALVLVIDRSGSMRGQKIELCKSAAGATVEVLTRKDFIGVVVFDSSARWVVPLTRAGDRAGVARQIAGLNAGGGTNIYPGMQAARKALTSVKARIKHMIVLTDGRTTGSGYEALAAQIKSSGITISTVAVGSDADGRLLQAIATNGGGKYYHTADPKAIPRIFTQDAMVHAGRLIREKAFAPKQSERHPMLKGWDAHSAPSLLGYIKTRRRAAAQVPLVTDLSDPLLAHWRFGLGKVTAFTSDCKSRWAALWIANWPAGYSQFWAQVLREMARPPQGQNMDLHIEERGHGARITVDLLEDAARFKNQAEVTADVYFVPAGALGSSLKHLQKLKLEQQGPGRYGGTFRPERPGVYLVRGRSGAQMVSAGLVRNISSEAAAGRVNRGLFEKVAAATGGTLFTAGQQTLARRPARHFRFLGMEPLVLQLLLLLFAADVVIRRWENARGMLELFGEFAAALRGAKAGKSV